MPRPNFYMSEKDRQTILSVIADYIGMWEDNPMDTEEYKELRRVQEKVRKMEGSKGFQNATIADALEIADRLKRKGKI